MSASSYGFAASSVSVCRYLIPITAACYDGLRADQTDQASTLINAARNTRRLNRRLNRLKRGGPPRPVAAEQACRAHRAHLARLSSNHAEPAGILRRARLLYGGQQVEIHASYLAYIDVFFVLAFIFILAMPLAPILRNANPKAGRGGMH